jgi:hypothetical protein
LQKHIEAFPWELDRQLPRLPDGYVRGLIGGSAIVLDKRTGTLIDVVRNVVVQAGL